MCIPISFPISTVCWFSSLFFFCFFSSLVLIELNYNKFPSTFHCIHTTLNRGIVNSGFIQQTIHSIPCLFRYFIRSLSRLLWLYVKSFPPRVEAYHFTSTTNISIRNGSNHEFEISIGYACLCHLAESLKVSVNPQRIVLLSKDYRNSMLRSSYYSITLMCRDTNHPPNPITTVHYSK